MCIRDSGKTTLTAAITKFLAMQGGADYTDYKMCIRDRNKGVQKLLDAIVDYMPSPVDIPAIDGVNPDTGEEDVRHADDNAPFSGLRCV